ncbi:MAG TPA: hypothetical protein V6D14_35610 [Coleofasciculaceae cyanobacterium]|jgi:hypothetical protein
MRTIKSLGWVVGLSIVVGALSAAPARADKSFSDITGTNIWNNTAPIFDTDTKLDPKLIENITRVNRDSESAFNACNAAVAQAEQNVPTSRRFARQPSTQTAEVPTACRQLEQLRTEAENLRRTAQEVERSRGNSAFLTW